MALEVDTLKQNDGLKELTDEQLNTIATMSKNDEAKVLGTYTSKYKAKINEVTGMAIGDDEDTETYLGRVIKDYKDKAAGTPEIKTQLDAALKENATLKEKIEKGAGDEELKRALGDTKAKLDAVTKERDDNKAAFDKERADYKSQIFNNTVKAAYDKVISKLKFKEEYSSDTIKRALIEHAYSEVSAFGKIGLDKDGNIEFRDENDVVMLNPKSSNKPYTMEDVVMATSLKDAITVGNIQGGAGSGSKGGDEDYGNNPIFTEAKSIFELDEKIQKYLLDRGFTVTSPEYQKKFSEIRKANKDALKLN